MTTLIVGTVLIVAGLAITVGTYAHAQSNGGGTYIVSWGPIVFGVIAVIRGIVGLVATRNDATAGVQFSTASPPWTAAGSSGGFTYGQGPGQAPSWQAAPSRQAVPSAPAAPAPSPAGWQPDPWDPSRLRWWDGKAFTEHSRPR